DCHLSFTCPATDALTHELHSSGRSFFTMKKTLLFVGLLVSLAFVFPARAAILKGNLFPNSDFETDSNADGTPNFWNKGGSAPTFDVWTTSASLSPTHSLQL